MTRYNHAFDIGFSLTSRKEDATDVTNEMHYQALLKRINDCHFGRDDDLINCTGNCFDTYVEEA